MPDTFDRRDLGRALLGDALGPGFDALNTMSRSELGAALAHAGGGIIAAGNAILSPAPAPAAPPTRSPTIDRAVRRALDTCDLETLRFYREQGTLTPAERVELEGIELGQGAP